MTGSLALAFYLGAACGGFIVHKIHQLHSEQKGKTK